MTSFFWCCISAGWRVYDHLMTHVTSKPLIFRGFFENEYDNVQALNEVKLVSCVSFVS
jgi:hypothetical protein